MVKIGFLAGIFSFEVFELLAAENACIVPVNEGIIRSYLSGKPLPLSFFYFCIVMVHPVVIICHVLISPYEIIIELWAPII